MMKSVTVLAPLVTGEFYVKSELGGFQKNEVFFNIKVELISFIHIRSHLYLKCVLSRCQTLCKIS